MTSQQEISTLMLILGFLIIGFLIGILFESWKYFKKTGEYLKDVKKRYKTIKETDLKTLTLVKWDYDGLPEQWRDKNPNPYKDMVFMYFGEVDGMKGHSFLQCMKTGKPFILHTEQLMSLTENEHCKKMV
jgi:hypothetical protein